MREWNIKLAEKLATVLTLDEIEFIKDNTGSGNFDLWDVCSTAIEIKENQTKGE